MIGQNYARMCKQHRHQSWKKKPDDGLEWKFDRFKSSQCRPHSTAFTIYFFLGLMEMWHLTPMVSLKVKWPVTALRRYSGKITRFLWFRLQDQSQRDQLIGITVQRINRQLTRYSEGSLGTPTEYYDKVMGCAPQRNLFQAGHTQHNVGPRMSKYFPKSASTRKIANRLQTLPFECGRLSMEKLCSDKIPFSSPT